MCHVNTGLVMSVLWYKPGLLVRGGGAQTPSQVTTVLKLFVLKQFLITE